MYWPEDHPDGRLPGIPGNWRIDGDAVLVTADGTDGLTLDGRPVSSETRLGTDGGTSCSASGSWWCWSAKGPGAYGTSPPPRGAPRLPGHRGHAVRSALVGAGALHPVRRTPHRTLLVTVEADGILWAVFGDTASGTSRFRFRFLRPAASDGEGRTAVDFSRVLLPPRAFADHFICLFPPPGNTLDAAVEAGEWNLG